MTTVNTRRHYTLDLTNEFFGVGRPNWAAGHRERGTVRQLLSAYDHARKVTGGCGLAYRFVGDAPALSITLLRADLEEQQEAGR